MTQIALSPPRPYALRRAFTWRPASDGASDVLEVDDPRGGPPVRYKAWTGKVLQGILDGASYAQLGAHWPGRDAPDVRELRARRFVLGLHHLGYVDIPFETPEAFGGRFRALRELGRGGMGVATLCEDLQGGGRCVVKRAWDFLHPLAMAEDALRAEARTLARLEHPGVPAFIASFSGSRSTRMGAEGKGGEHDEASGAFHLARGYVEGEDLRVHLRNPLGRDEAQRIVGEIADILAHVHERGFLLLDLGPGNFAKRPDGRIMLLDVGMAREAPAGTLQLDAPVGAPGFVAPETLRTGVATREGERWALGALYGFLRTGVVPPRDGDLAPLAARLDADERATLSL